jgi:ABC-type transporter Mla maintaining outer membrane lipid asymmetry ATPase subunit MlaF
MSISGEENQGVTAVIETRRLTKDYGGGRGLFDLDLHVAEGEYSATWGRTGRARARPSACSWA